MASAVKRRRSISEETQIEATAAPQAVPVSERISAQLTVLVGPQVGRVFELTQGVFTVGRSPQASICIPHASISRLHATVRVLGDGSYELEDLGSRNGSRVDGVRIQGRKVLRSGNRVQLGSRVQLRFAIVDQLERRVKDAENLEAFGRLSAAVNHDLNNLLSVLTCGLSHLASLDPSTPMGTGDVGECLDDMRVAAQRAGELTHRLSALARKPVQASSTHAQGPVHVTALCEEVVRLVRHIVPQNLRVETDIQEDLWVDGSRACLHQLLMNPCINARDAMPDHGVLRIEARHARPEEIAARPELEPSPHILISIIDDGPGIPEELLPKVFQPFFTTKGAGKGTGLGLATVARVAHEHGGTVHLASKPGSGTALRIFLPDASRGQTDTLRPSTEAKNSGPAPVPGAKVLLVDEEPAILRAVGRALQRHGHHVTQASRAAEAIELVGSALPDVVVMDLDTAETLADCVAQMRAVAPQVRVILTSGELNPRRERELVTAGISGIVHKPFDLQTVARAIDRALQGCGDTRIEA